MGGCQKILHNVSITFSCGITSGEQYLPSVTTVEPFQLTICAVPDRFQAEKWDALTRNWYVAPSFTLHVFCRLLCRQDNGILSQIKLFLVDEVRASNI